MVDKRINNSDKSDSVDVSRTSRSHEQDGRHAYARKKTQPLCPVLYLLTLR